jgi:CBS-domain-containing membrane protein
MEKKKSEKKDVSENPIEKGLNKSPLDMEVCNIEISDEDIYEAMKRITGYLDITLDDFKEVYRHAYRHALERIVHSTKARDIMTRDVVCVRTDTLLEDVAEKMGGKGFSGVPVIEEDGRVVGIISEKDFLSQMEVKDTVTFMGLVAACLRGDGCLAISIRGKRAENIMTAPAITVNEDTPVVEIAALFTEKNINRVPVLNDRGNLCGFVSRTDIVKASL